MKITVNSIELNLPDVCEPSPIPAGFPSGSASLSFQKEQTMAYILFIPMSIAHAMPRHALDTVIAKNREGLAENEGLVDAGEGKSDSGEDMVYVIEKRREADDTVTYLLYCHYFKEDQVIHIQGYFNAAAAEERETEVRKVMEKEGIPVEPWCHDPFDSSVSDGFLMNQSEQENFDGMFPYHPLTMCRAFRDYIAENN